MKLLAFYNNYGPVDVKMDLMTFSAGESHVKLHFNRPCNVTRLVIKGNIVSAKDILDVVMIRNAISNHFPDTNPQVDLFTGYLPYSRSDRVCAPGEEFGLEAFANIINSLKFTNVYTIDVHSNVAFNLIGNLINIKQSYMLRSIEYVFDNYDFVCAPDKGASLKISEIVNYTGLELVQGTKIRDPETGKLSGFGVEFPTKKELAFKNVIIVDDICDGGGTFIGLADILRKEYGVKDIGLLVTHGIYSAGIEKFKKEDIYLYCINDLLGNYSSIADYDTITDEILTLTPKVTKTIS